VGRKVREEGRLPVPSWSRNNNQGLIQSRMNPVNKRFPVQFRLVEGRRRNGVFERRIN
jgi:hypothetical protein